MERGIFVTITEIEKLLDHDDIFFTTYADMEALERIIALIKFLSEKNPSDEVKIAEILSAANIEAVTFKK